MKNIAIVLSAGKGSRMNSDTAKQYMLLSGKPVLYYSLKAFEDSKYIDGIILVTGASDIDNVKEDIVKKYDFTKVISVVAGGKQRYHSVAAGLEAIAALNLDCEYVYIHDGARPFVDDEILKRAHNTVAENHTAIVSMPVKDTIKIADGNGFVVSTPNRSSVYMMQTPQVFDYMPILDAYRKLIGTEEEVLSSGVQVTDDAMVMETFGEYKIKLSEGSYENIKITTPEDMEIAESILNRRIKSL